MQAQTNITLDAFRIWLEQAERSPGTVEKYTRDVTAFLTWLNDRELTKQSVAEWKTHLIEQRYAPVTINTMLVALNAYLNFIDAPECRVKQLRLQRRLFRPQTRELSREEYDRLLDTARAQGRERLALLMETICATGIRVSELRYITAESVAAGRAEISLKGKIRTILLPTKLCRKLQKYAKKQKIVSGEIFLTRNGRPLSRKQIWAEMKSLCEAANVAPTKVFPHNLRHLFARTFYRACRDVSRLADVLGHSSLETTRIYLISSGAEHIRQLDRLGLVS